MYTIDVRLAFSNLYSELFVHPYYVHALYLHKRHVSYLHVKESEKVSEEERVSSRGGF